MSMGRSSLGRRWKGSGRYNEGGNSRCCREVFLGAFWGRGRILCVGVYKGRVRCSMGLCPEIRFWTSGGLDIL